MKKQKTVIDQLVAKLGFRADPEALDIAKRKLRDLETRVQAARAKEK